MLKKIKIITLSIISLFLCFSIGRISYRHYYIDKYCNMMNISVNFNYVIKIKKLSKSNDSSLFIFELNGGYLEREDEIKHIKINDYVFGISKGKMAIYKDKTMYYLDDAYYKGIINIDDVKKYHEATTEYVNNIYYLQQIGDADVRRFIRLWR